MSEDAHGQRLTTYAPRTMTDLRSEDDLETEVEDLEDDDELDDPDPDEGEIGDEPDDVDLNPDASPPVARTVSPA